MKTGLARIIPFRLSRIAPTLVSLPMMLMLTAAAGDCGQGLSCQSAQPVAVHAKKAFDTTSLPYAATAVGVSQAVVFQQSPLNITGQAVNERGDAVAFVPLIVVIAYQGFEVPIEVSTDADGQFSLSYQSSGEVVGEHTVSVIHPDALTDANYRPGQSSFTVSPKATLQAKASTYADVQFSQDLLKTGVSFKGSVTETLAIANQGTGGADDLQLSLSSADNFTWGYISSPKEKEELTAGETWSASLTFAPPKNFTQEGTFDFTLSLTYGTSPQTVTRTLPVKVTVTTDQVGGYTFKVEDMYTAYQGTGGNNGVENARIMLMRDGTSVAAGAGRTDSNGAFTYNDLPTGLYDYQISADKHTSKSGEIFVSAGITRDERIYLDIPVVKVDWSVTETVIADKYDIVVDATYETDVPAPVIVIEPAVVVLPAMKQGEVITGTLKITNQGLISMYDTVSSLPDDDKYLDYTFNVDALPDKLLPMQTVYLPYRITAKRDLALDPLDIKKLSATSGEVLNLNKATPQAKASCVYRFGYYKDGNVKCNYECASGDQRSSSSSVRFIHTGDSASYTCGSAPSNHLHWYGGGGGGGWGGTGAGGGGGIYSGIGNTYPGMSPCSPGTPCQDCCGSPPFSGGPGGSPGGGLGGDPDF